MNINPYESSPSHATTPKMQPNKLGAIGFTCSACGVAGVIGGMLLTAQFGVSAAFQLLIAISLLSCPVGLVLSLIGAFSTPRRLAIWGVLHWAIRILTHQYVLGNLSAFAVSKLQPVIA